ncbi:MAG: signal peptidase I [Ruminococcus sp.]|uniref:signal peptidase I n=1 Tax=Ruminococcus sp. TaxID=41978 RepID=UPI001B248C30|nr:signal peptidase I [Ruminococcus sp.]MBO7474425.1 signal peptidase I [Ruminococcus sp.]
MKKILRVGANVVAWIVLIFALLITIIVFSSGKNNGVANLFGYIPMTVESDSMKPTFSKNDLIICKEIDDLNSLKEGDVITFWTIIEGQRVKNTHRIVGVNDDGGSRSFITRGDNNPVDDTSPAYASDIIGKWTNTKIAGLGKFMAFLRTKKGFFICILIPMALFFLFELYKFIVALIEVKRPEPAEQLDEEEIKRRAIEEYLASKGETADKLAVKAEAAKETVSDAAEKLEEKAEAIKDSVKEKASDAAEKLEEKAEAIKDAAKEKASDAAEKLGEKAEALKEETAKELSEIAEKTNDNAG